ncbi:hypothetical protein Q31b_57530 [Novipirellula aureliae]|uniref:Uncharacterized protein n=1 Tax=Novipirellula aureliae TaxID=2527966 RepID=A0A5C6DDZ1_9BACT|nr:hypothetical protein [Novipirellula aureliae]TWU33436.1 hypothetical protein Q31b_57530 [Novipirellula aureliae]
MLPSEGLRLTDYRLLGEICYLSDAFSDCPSPAYAAAKLLAGRDLGLKPIEAMLGLSFVAGRLVINVSSLSAVVARSRHYAFCITQQADNEIGLEFTKNGEVVGISTASNADLIGVSTPCQNISGPDSRALLSLALARGVRACCPDLIGVDFCVEGELAHSDRDAWDEDIIDVDFEICRD